MVGAVPSCRNRLNGRKNVLETGPWGNKSGLTAVQPRGGNGPVAVGNISLKLPEVISISVLVKKMVYIYKITRREYGTKKRCGLRRDPLGDMNNFLWWGEVAVEPRLRQGFGGSR